MATKKIRLKSTSVVITQKIFPFINHYITPKFYRTKPRNTTGHSGSQCFPSRTMALDALELAHGRRTCAKGLVRGKKMNFVITV